MRDGTASAAEGSHGALLAAFDAQGIRAIVEAAGVAVWRYDARRDEVVWSAELCRIAGRAEDDYPRTYEAWREIVHPEDRARVEANVQDSLARGEYPDMEHRIVRPDGGVRHILAKGFVTTAADGSPLEMAGVVVDLTEKRLRDLHLREDMRLESLGRLAGGVAHDFNNMLTVILGSANLALDLTPEGDPVAECLGAIRDAAERSATLTGQLLAFARRHTSRPERRDLGALLAQGLALMSRLLGRRIALDVSLARGLTVDVDPAQLQQVLMNLAANARDAMPDGGRLSLRLSPASSGRRAVALLEVADDGVGIPDDVLPRVFEPFFTTKGPTVSGLGLASVYGIVRQHGGSISIESRGRGTRVAIEWPLAEGASRAADPDVADLAEARPRGTPKGLILLVDDEPRVRAVTATLLRQLGHEVLEAHDGVEALALAAARPPDLLVTDLAMPRLGGLELIEALRAERPALPAMVLTGLGADPDDARKDADVAWLVKPFHPDQLAERVTLMLSEALAASRAPGPARG